MRKWMQRVRKVSARSSPSALSSFRGGRRSDALGAAAVGRIRLNMWSKSPPWVRPKSAPTWAIPVQVFPGADQMCSKSVASFGLNFAQHRSNSHTSGQSWSMPGQLTRPPNRSKFGRCGSALAECCRCRSNLCQVPRNTDFDNVRPDFGQARPGLGRELGREVHRKFAREIGRHRPVHSPTEFERLAFFPDKIKYGPTSHLKGSVVSTHTDLTHTHAEVHQITSPFCPNPARRPRFSDASTPVNMRRWATTNALITTVITSLLCAPHALVASEMRHFGHSRRCMDMAIETPKAMRFPYDAVGCARFSQ